MKVYIASARALITFDPPIESATFQAFVNDYLNSTLATFFSF